MFRAPRLVSSLPLLLVLLIALPSWAQGGDAQPLRIHMISGSREYKSEPSLRAWSEAMVAEYAVEFTASWAEDGGKTLPDIAGLDDADVLVVFARRMSVPEEEFAHVEGYLKAGKPVIGIRTASHAFNNMKGFDGDVLGGSYSGHGGDETITVTAADGAGDHVVLEGVEGWEGPGKLYKNPKNPEASVILLRATGGKMDEPVAWVHEYQLEGGEAGRAFYTSLGIPEDFENENFQRLLLNAVEWATERELEERDAEEAAMEVGGVMLAAEGGLLPTLTVKAEDDPQGGEPAEAEQSEEAVEEMTDEEQRELYEDVDLPTGDPSARPQEAHAVDPDRVVPEYPGHLGQHMDYGPALSSSLIFDPGDKKTQIAVDRVLTVQLPHSTSIAYDMNTMSPVGGWTGDFLDLSNTHHQSMKGSLPPRSSRTIFYRAPEGPVWAWTGEGDAPKNEDPYGAVPKEWIDYHGHYIHGERVVFSYDVLGRGVLESPTLVQPGKKELVLVRTYRIEGGDQPLRLRVIDGPVQSARYAASIKSDAAAGGVTLSKREGGGTMLEVPASDGPVTVSVFLAADDVAPSALTDEVAKGFTQPDLEPMTRGGPAHWDQPVTTDGTLGEPRKGYANDDIALPTANPFGSWMQPADIAFMQDGTLVMTTLGGDVWLVSNFTDDLKNVEWKRFATGLYEPMGVYVDTTGDEDAIYVTGRDRITRLHDLNGDREADFYENFYDGGNTDISYHGFVFGLDRDAEGYWYLARSGRKIDPNRPHQSAVIRVSPDGTSDEDFAKGLRHPNGLAIVGPDGMLLVSDNQGEFIPASKQSLIERGGFYGYRQEPNYRGPMKQNQPLFWLPHKVDNSSGEAGYASDERWGPLAGKYLHTSYGACKLFYFMPQTIGDVKQAAVVEMPFFFKSGIMRVAVNPADGQVYASGLKGWDTKAEQDGCLSRVRYTGKPATMITDVQTQKDGILVSFNQPIAQPKPDDIKVERWNYIYSQKYGSPQMSVENPKSKGEDDVPVQGMTLSDDGLSLKLAIADLKPVMQMRLDLSDVKTRDGGDLDQTVYMTLNAVPE